MAVNNKIKICYSLLVLLLQSVTETISYYKYTTADYLDSLDYIICSQITEPTADYCEQLYDNLDKYSDSLQGLLDNVRERNVYEGEAVANYWSLGKPKFTQDYDVPVFQALEKVLSESHQDIKLFYTKLNTVKDLWEQFREECEKNKDFCEPALGMMS